MRTTIIFLLSAGLFGCASPSTDEPNHWYITQSVEVNLVQQKKTMELTARQALKVIDSKTDPIAEDWAELLPETIGPAETVRPIPSDAKAWSPAQEPRPLHIQILGFDNHRIHVALVREVGHMRWAGYYTVEADLMLTRSDTLDRRLDFDAFAAPFVRTVKGVGQGISREEVHKLLGAPDATQYTQAAYLNWEYYFDENVTIEFQGHVYQIFDEIDQGVLERVEPSFVVYHDTPEEKAKFTEPDKELYWASMWLRNGEGENVIHLGPSTRPKAARGLISFLADEDAGIRASAIGWLAVMAEDAEPARAALQVCLKDSDEKVRVEAQRALGRLDRVMAFAQQPGYERLSLGSTRWHTVLRGKQATVSVERALYEKPGSPHFYVKVRLINIGRKDVLYVDLREGDQLIYPNQWGVLKTDQRQDINERRLEIAPLNDAQQAAIRASAEADELLAFPKGTSLVYFCPFNASGRKDVEAKIAEVEGAKHLFISLDGRLVVVNGSKVEQLSCAWEGDDEREELFSDLILPLPITWKTVSGHALVLRDE